MSIFTQTQDRWQNSRLSDGPEQEQRLRRGLHLRAENERGIWQLQKLLPFRWQSGIKKTTAPPPGNFYPPAVPATHIMLLEPCAGPVTRAAGDMLCSVAVDTSTGVLRFEGQPAEQWNDGNGGQYEPQPTCKLCLKAAQKFKSNDRS